MSNAVYSPQCYHEDVNETILVLKLALDFSAVFFAYRLGKEWLYASIVVNLLLITIVGAKLVPVFGLVTNGANVYYAGVFLAMFLLLEHARREDAVRAVAIGVCAVAIFQLLMQTTLWMSSAPSTTEVSAMMQVLLGSSARITLASLAAFFVAAHIVIALYALWRERAIGPHWVLRIVSLVMLAQLIDSIIFFFIAFWGKVPTSLVFESMVVGYVLKVALGIVSVPFIYMSYYLKDEVQR